MRRRFLVAGLLAVALTGAWAPTAGAATDFFSSSRARRPAPDLGEHRRPRPPRPPATSGVTGPADRHPRQPHRQGRRVSANGENAGPAR